MEAKIQNKCIISEKTSSTLIDFIIPQIENEASDVTEQESPPGKNATPEGHVGNQEEITTESLTNTNIKEFNKTFNEYLRTKSENSIDKLNRSLALLASSMNPADINPECTEIATFFINLHELMNTMESRSALLWSSVALLEQVTQSSHMRVALVERFKFLQVLAKLLESVCSPERILYILHVLENISYGICITWQEPYLSRLIKTLVKYINSEKENLKLPALSVLINLCYKNLPSVYILMRTISIEQFLSDIQSFGILACKMSFILENNSEHVSTADIHKFIEFTFSEMFKSLKNYNTGALRHTVNFFLEMKSYEKLSRKFLDYPKYCEDINQLLKIINNCIKEYNSQLTKDLTFDLPSCLCILFILLDNLISWNGDQIKILLPIIVNLAIQWINSDKAGAQSLQLLTTIIQKDDDLEYLQYMYREIEINLSQTFDILHAIKTSPEQVNALLKLSLELIKQATLTDRFNTAIKKFLFERIFADFLNATIGQEQPKPIPNSHISMYLRALILSMKMSEIMSNDEWKENLDYLLNTPVIQFIIAKAILSENDEICSLVFLLSKIDSFPISEISKKICDQGIFLSVKASNPTQQECNMETFYNNFINVNLEKRLDELITKLMEANENNQIGNVLMSDIMELFELKIAICSNSEKDLLARLDECNAEVTSLSHKVTILSAELSRYQTQTFFLQMTIQKLKAEAITLKRENARLMKLVNNFESTIAEERMRVENLIKENELKDAEVAILNKNLLTTSQEILKKDKEISHLQDLISIEETESKQLEKRIEDLVELTNQLNRQILEKEDCIIVHNNEIEDLTKENSTLEEKVSEIEILLQEKENLLKNYAEDLQDVEDMRTQVVSIIQAGKGHPVTAGADTEQQLYSN